MTITSRSQIQRGCQQFKELRKDRSQLFSTPVIGDNTVDLTFSGASVGAGGNADKLGILINSKQNSVHVTQPYWTVDGKPAATMPPNSTPVPTPLMGMGVLPLSPGDPPLTVFNDFDQAIGVRGLRYVVNLLEAPFEQDLATVLPFGSPLSDFILAPHSSMTFNLPGDITPGTYLYAEGQAYDPTFTTFYGTTIFGHQSVPEPTSVLLLSSGLVGLAAWRMRSTRCTYKCSTPLDMPVVEPVRVYN